MFLDPTTAGVAGSGVSPVRVRVLEWAAVICLLIGLIVTAQIWMGAYEGEFSEDEASHYISGLFLKEFLLSGSFGAPLTYLREFHSRYPLVGIGHWGPFYYGVEAVWMTVFSQSKNSVIALAGVGTLIVALVIYGALAKRLGRLEAGFGALAFVLAPVVLVSSGELMLDVPVALLCLLSMLAYMRFLDTGYLRYSVGFGVMAAAALLIKGNAACLALLPALTVLLTGRWDLIRDWRFWAPVPIVLVTAGPWYVVTYGLIEQGFRYSWSLDYVLTATTENSKYLFENLGPLILVLAGLGIAFLFVRTKRPADSLLVAASALFFSVWIFQSVVPAAIQDRYLIPALPAVIIAAAFGIRIVSSTIGPAWSTLARFRQLFLAGLLALALISPIMVRGLGVESKPIFGFAAAAAQASMVLTERNPAVLIVANGRGETAAISELAMIDSAPPSLFAVRGSRIFGGGGYNNHEYLPRFEDAADLMRAIDEYSIPLMILQRDPGRTAWTHIRQVEDLLKLYPDRWRLISRHTDGLYEISVFGIRGNEAKAIPTEKMMLLTGPRSLDRL